MNDKTPDFEELFHAALELKSEEREQFLQVKCGNDLQLLDELREMLASHEKLGSCLEKPPAEAQETIIGQSEEDLATSMEAGLVPAFGDEAAIVIGDANHSVQRSCSKFDTAAP